VFWEGAHWQRVRAAIDAERWSTTRSGAPVP